VEHEHTLLEQFATPSVVLTLFSLALVLGACVGVLLDRLRATQRGRRSREARYQTMLEGASAAFFGIDADGGVAYVEGTGDKTVDLISRQSVGTRYDEGGVACPDLQRLIRDALAGRRAEGTILCAGRAARVRCLPVHKADGSLDGAVCVGADVSERLEMERSLRLARFTLEQAADAVLWVDSEGRLMEANIEAGRQFECDATDLVGMTVFDVNPVATEEAWRAHWQDLLEHGHARVETTHRTRGGREFPVEVVANLIEIDGDVLNVGFVRDISERKEAERALRESEQRLELALAGADLGLWDWDALSGRIQVNERWATMLGYEPTDTVAPAEHWQSLVHPEDLPGALASLRAHLQGDSDRFEAEVRMRTADGDWRWILSRGRVVERREDGRATRVAGTHLDISRLKEVEEALRHSERRYRSVIEDQTDLICRYRPDGTLTFANQAYARSLGLAPSEVVGMRFTKPIPEEERSRAMKHVRELARTLTPQAPLGPPIEHRKIGPDGETRWQQWLDRGLFDEQGRLIEIQSVGRDITDRIEVEQRLRLLNSELNHRVKNNLGVVAALADRTARECASLTDFQGVFARRVGAMARVHELIARREWRPTPIEELLRTVMGDFLDGAEASIDFVGPPVTLSAKQAVTLSLIARELVTNAAKHGALSGEGGAIELAWGIDETPEGEWLTLRWKERAAHAVAGSDGTSGDGLGMRLIESLALGDLRGETDWSVEEEGLRCSLRFPLAGAAESDDRVDGARNGAVASGA